MTVYSCTTIPPYLAAVLTSWESLTLLSIAEAKKGNYFYIYDTVV